VNQNSWHLITSEYPPQIGGVSDYTKLIAKGLADFGEQVHVWTPKEQEAGVRSRESEIVKEGVTVHREFGSFAPSDLLRVTKLLNQFPAPRRLLVQWVPHGYGYRSMNIAFCFWLWCRAKLKRDRVELMVHEPFLAFGEGSAKQSMAAAVHRLMVVILLQAASHVWVSIPEWEDKLRPFAFGKKKSFSALPVPSNIAVVDDPHGVARVRAQYADANTHLVGHFGAYDEYMTNVMSKILPSLVNGDGSVRVLLIGNGSSELRDKFIESHPEIKDSVHATGMMPADDISLRISACDLMLQPYQDGVSGRRTSVMTALAHGVPVLTTEGKATEKCWTENDVVQFMKVNGDASSIDTVNSLLANSDQLLRLGKAGRRLYWNCFAVKRTVASLRDTEGSES